MVKQIIHSVVQLTSAPRGDQPISFHIGQHIPFKALGAEGTICNKIETVRVSEIRLEETRTGTDQIVVIGDGNVQLFVGRADVFGIHFMQTSKYTRNELDMMQKKEGMPFTINNVVIEKGQGRDNKIVLKKIDWTHPVPVRHTFDQKEDPIGVAVCSLKDGQVVANISIEKELPYPLYPAIGLKDVEKNADGVIVKGTLTEVSLCSVPNQDESIPQIVFTKVPEFPQDRVEPQM